MAVGQVVAVTAIALALAGCGNQPESSTTSSPGDSIETWTERANSICQASRKEAESLGSPDDPKALADVYDATNRGFRRFIADMRAFTVPAAHAASFDEMVDMYERAMRTQERVPRALRTGDLDRAIALSDEVNRWGDRGDEIARRLELDECAKDPGE
jgi:hypothetical protein